MDGNFVRRYESAGETKKDGFSDSNVLECCKGILKTCKGHMFMFEDDYLEHGSRKYEKQRPFNIVSVVQCDMQGNEIARFPSVEDAALATGIKRPMISSAITGKCKSASGFIFVYENDFPIKDIEAHVQRKKGRAVAQINPETGEVIKTYDRISDAGKALGVSYKAIHKVVDKEDRTAYGFKWVSQYANTEVNGQITKG